MTVDVTTCLCLIHRLHPEAKVPAYAKPGDSGMDIAAIYEYVLPPGRPVKVSTGIAVGLPVGYEVQVRPRSGMSLRGIWAAPGTVDSGYVGEVCVTLLNVTDDVQAIAKGDRVAQLVLMPVPRVGWVEVQTQAELGTTERGTSGHGSTGS